MKQNRKINNKYNAKKVTIDGITFDSQHEANRYCELKLLEKCGAISNLELQKKYELIPAQYEYYKRYGKNGRSLKDGKRLLERACIYIADFVYQENGETIIEDAKGYRDPTSAGYAKFVIKRKLMLYKYGLKIREV